MSFFNFMNTAVADSVAAVATPDSLNTAKPGIIGALSALERQNHDEIQAFISSVGNEIFHFLINVLISILIYMVGRWLIRRAIAVMDKAFDSRNIELSVRSFLKSIMSIVAHIVLILTIVQVLGINTTSLVAMLASAGLAIGMALSGTLQNFAGGVMILFLKPYRVGDFITSQGQSGVVKEIMLFTTVLETPDRHTIFVPNSAISSSIIDNASFADTRRVDLSVGLTYGDSVAEARKVIMEIVESDVRVINNGNATTKPMVGITGLGDSAVNITVRVWVKTSDYWDTYFSLYERIYETLPKRGLAFPFPQLDVHIQNNNN